MGISAEVQEEVPFEGVYEKEKTEFVAATGAFDVVAFYPAYIGDFAGNGYLEPLDNYMKKQPSAVWDPNPTDVPAPFRELYCKFGGKVYAPPIDGDGTQYIKSFSRNINCEITALCTRDNKKGKIIIVKYGLERCEVYNDFATIRNRLYVSSRQVVSCYGWCSKKRLGGDVLAISSHYIYDCFKIWRLHDKKNILYV